MNGIMQRSLGILELLVTTPPGLPLGEIAQTLDIPRSACHRLLTDLCKLGYVRQLRDHGDYVLTTKLVSMGLNFLSETGVVDIAQPLLDRLATASGELVRLSVLDGDILTWVAKAQGARQGLRYDPEMGSVARLSCSASGHAWLLTMRDDEALAKVEQQGWGDRASFGPQAPQTPAELLAALQQARQRGFAITVDTFTPGMAAMAAPVRRPGRPALGVISIAGPSVRLTLTKMQELGPLLLDIADELASASGASLMFGRPQRAGSPHPLTQL